MKDDVVVQVDKVSKKFCRSLRRSMWYGAVDIVNDALCLRPNRTRLRKKEFWAVEDVSLELRRGEVLGIIGPNGSGKTTILKMLNGIVLPDAGTITVRGRVGALIALGAGFHPQLTGRENIYINGAILGMSKREIDKKFDQIVDFSEMREFLDMPVKHYSSGMFVRLAFSVSVHLDPAIVLIDEVLAVGDVSFRVKSYEFVKKLRHRGVGIILISHNLPTVYEMCDRTMLLWKGRVRFTGDTAEAIGMLTKEMFIPQDSKEAQVQFVHDPLLGEIEVRGGGRIKSVCLLDERGREIPTFTNGQRHVVKSIVRFDRDVENPVFGCFVWDKKGRVLHDAFTLQMGIDTGRFEAGKDYAIKWYLTPHLLPDYYHVGLSVSQCGLEHYFYDRRVKALSLCVDSNSRALGIVDMDTKLEIERL
jgi:lipopolysaccharide transport system ATP-binding protein